MDMATTPVLLAYLQGSVPLDALPNALTLDESLWQSMDGLWQRSVARLSEGIVVEWGGLLRLQRNRLRLVNTVSGTAEGLILTMPADSRFVGSFHTHPHAAGYVGIGFSGADVADTVNQGERISVVQSGPHIFVLLRTEKTPSSLNVDDWRSRMNTLFEEAYQQRSSILAASLVANRATCQDLALTLYYGRVFRPLVEVYRP